MQVYDHDTFKAVVLYIAWRTRQDPKFGRTKVAKALFYADFSAFAEEGKPLTGARYEHWEFGPFPPALYEVQEELVRAGVAKVTGGRETGRESKLVPLGEPSETGLLAAWQRALLDLQIDRLSESASWRVSDDSHEHPGWLLTADREEIPYESALLAREAPSAAAMTIARQRFAQLDD